MGGEVAGNFCRIKGDTTFFVVKYFLNEKVLGQVIYTIGEEMKCSLQWHIKLVSAKDSKLKEDPS